MLRFLVVFIGVIVLVVAGAVGFVWVKGESLITQGVSERGPALTGTPVRLDGVTFQPLGGTAGIRGFVVGTPEGYSADKSISVGEMSLTVAPMSLLSDTIQLADISVIEPEIVVEPSKRGLTNLQVIQKNIEKATGPAPADSGEPAKNLIIERLHIAAPKLRFSGGAVGLSDQTLDLADITLTGIGVDQNGVPPAEVVRLVADALMPQVTKAMASDRAQELFDKLTKGKVDLQLGGDIKQQIEDKADALKDKAKQDMTDKVRGTIDEKLGGEAGEAARGLFDKLKEKAEEKKEKNGEGEDGGSGSN
ncbi:hypothetical protein CCR80_02110 [Rhodothalassium salexigens]|uniref:hypothetical protein n=1 Tax=Rhodothalassium salexigens TaxID=1086 RepID=UPI001911FB44|nr:hypothetical protein [Rhodothalassium salexigens]MBK5919831.1 hypothetical protein [Rhodothalassium salexigens]